MKIVLVLVALVGVAVAQPSPGAPAPPPAQSPDVMMLRKSCVDAMNADPEFAKSIIATADKQIDQRTIDAHLQATAQIEENKRHVIYAYAAMWILAALFVAFLWFRQQRLKAEIAILRRDLDAAAKDHK